VFELHQKAQECFRVFGQRDENWLQRGSVN
jgi:hypothetical protein